MELECDLDSSVVTITGVGAKECFLSTLVTLFVVVSLLRDSPDLGGCKCEESYDIHVHDRYYLGMQYLIETWILGTSVMKEVGRVA